MAFGAWVQTKPDPGLLHWSLILLGRMVYLEHVLLMAIIEMQEGKVISSLCLPTSTNSSVAKVCHMAKFKVPGLESTLHIPWGHSWSVDVYATTGERSFVTIHSVSHTHHEYFCPVWVTKSREMPWCFTRTVIDHYKPLNLYSLVQSWTNMDDPFCSFWWVIQKGDLQTCMHKCRNRC